MHLFASFYFGYIFSPLSLYTHTPEREREREIIYHTHRNIHTHCIYKTERTVTGCRARKNAIGMESSGKWLEKALLELCKKVETGLELDGEIISGLVSYCEMASPLDAKEYLDVIILLLFLSF